MTQLICQFSPALLSVYLIRKERKDPYTPLEFIVLYGIMVGIINMLVIAVTAIFFSHAYTVIDRTLFYGSYTYRYLFLAFVCEYVLPKAYFLGRTILRIELTARLEGSPDQSPMDGEEPKV